MEEGRETVVLEIEGTTLKCNKKILIENSAYFAAMFTGGFRESSLEKVKIQGVDLKSFNTILLLLWDRNYIIEEDQFHLVLQVACMLQFEEIKHICQTRIVAILKPSICVRIWKTAELLDLTQLWLKAKYMALEDFDDICDNSIILELSIDDICSYLGHIYLSTKHELTVFQTAMNWWYENQKFYGEEDFTKVILKLLNCLDFKVLTENDIMDMQSYADIADNTEIISILNCVIDLKTNGINVGGNFSENDLHYAIHLCNAKSRQRTEMPCILMHCDRTHNTGPSMNKRLNKRNEVNTKNVVVFDASTNEFRNIFLLDGGKVRDLMGFKLLPYKQFIFLYGGEYLIGGGNWNCNFWTYNTIKEKWERRNMLPHGRRHFETLILDDCIYIIGGVGRFRVIQNNMIWYDFKADGWSSLVQLPSEESYRMKCCSFLGQVLIVCLGERHAYFFNKEQLSWRRIKILIDKKVADEIKDFAVFSDSNYFYIKGTFLIKFKLEGETLIPTKQISLKEINFNEIQAVLCNGIVYTLYKCLDVLNFFYAFEWFHLETEQVYYVFKQHIQEERAIEIDQKFFALTQYTKLFSLNYYHLVKENVCINESLE